VHVCEQLFGANMTEWQRMADSQTCSLFDA